MPKKLTYKRMKDYINGEEGNGCELSSEEKEIEEIKTEKGINTCYVKLNIKCKCGNIFYTNHSEFKNDNKRQCNTCGGKSRSKIRSLTYEEIEEAINKTDCKLLTNKITFDKDKITQVKSSNIVKLEIECGCNNRFITTFSKFKQGKCRCNDCSAIIQKNKMKFTYDEVKTIIETTGETNCELISNTYIKNTGLLKIQCECGNIFETTLSLFQLSQNKGICPECPKERKSRLKTQEQFLKEVYDLVGNEYTILGEYIKAKEKILIRHNCEICESNEYETTPNTFLDRGCRCPACAIINNSGVSSHYYNKNLTDEVREKRRSRLYGVNQTNFRNSVFVRDNYSCQCCGNRSSIGNQVALNAHHLNGYNWDEIHRFDINNGVTLCKDCHKEFHVIYGYGNNTKEQYIEWDRNKNIKVGENNEH